MLSFSAVTRWPRCLFCAFALAAAVAAPATVAHANAPSLAQVSADIAADLNKAAGSGPRALIKKLEDILRANPGLATNPATAAELARAAAGPVSGFVGDNVPVYRDIVARIVDAAPEAARSQVGEVVGEAVRRIAATDPMVRDPLVKDIETLLAEARERAGRATPKRGIRVGSFIVYPEMQVSGFHDDNIFATKTDKTSDYAAVISPHVFINSDWERHYVRLQAHYDATRYESETAENTDDYWFAGEGRYDFSKTTNVFGGLLYGRFHEDRSSPDDVDGIEPTLYHERRAYGGVSHTVGKFTMRVGGTFEHTRFDDTQTSTATINNSDRDWNHISVGPSLSYKLSDVFEPFVEGKGDIRRYLSNLDDAGVDRDSAGYVVRAGTKFKLTGKLDGQVFVGYGRQNYAAATLEDIGVMMFRGDVRWRALPSTLLTAWADRSIEETTLTNASAYVYSTVGASVEHSLTDSLAVIVRGTYGLSDFYGAGREDDDYGAGATLRYSITDNYYVAADYRYEKRISDVSTSDYDRNLIYLRVGAQY